MVGFSHLELQNILNGKYFDDYKPNGVIMDFEFQVRHLQAGNSAAYLSISKKVGMNSSGETQLGKMEMN